MLRGFQVFVSGMAIAAVTVFGASVAEAQDAPAAPKPPTLTLQGDVVLITMLIKEAETASFEKVLEKLKESLAKSEKPERRQQAAGWEVLKATQGDGKGNAIYVMVINKPVPNQEYDITMLIAEVFPVEVQEIFKLYKAAFAGRGINSFTSFMKMQ